MADDSFTSTRTISSDDLARLKRDREAVDRKYNAALTALDRAVQQLPPLADPPPRRQTTPRSTRSTRGGASFRTTSLSSAQGCGPT